MVEASDDDFERIANRLALLVSETGEADNAGRAVGALARKLGLSGGDLKQIFLTGAGGGAKARRATFRRADLDAAKLERENSSLRHSLKLAEVAARTAEGATIVLQGENERLRQALDSRIATGRRRVMIGAFTAGVVATISLVLIETRWRETASAPGALEADAAAGLAVPRAARVRSSGTALFPGPERTGAVITVLPSGTKLVVRRLFWRSMMQWAEVDAPGRHGYVVTTEIDIS